MVQGSRYTGKGLETSQFESLVSLSVHLQLGMNHDFVFIVSQSGSQNTKRSCVINSYKRLQRREDKGMWRGSIRK